MRHPINFLFILLSEDIHVFLKLLHDSNVTPQRLTVEDQNSPKQKVSKKAGKGFVDHNEIKMELANNFGTSKGVC